MAGYTPHRPLRARERGGTANGRGGSGAPGRGRLVVL